MQQSGKYNRSAAGPRNTRAATCAWPRLPAAATAASAEPCIVTPAAPFRIAPCSSSASKPPATKPASRVYDTDRGLLAHALHSQVAMHGVYGGVVPELASRDHVRRVVPARAARAGGGAASRSPTSTASPTRRGPGLAGALLVGASVASALGYALGKPAIGVHHLEGHLLSPLLADPRPAFPFVALLVSGGHSQLFEVEGVGRYRLLGDTKDDAAGEAFDKTAKLLGLGYPGGPALARLAEAGRDGAVVAAAADARQRRSRHELQRLEDRGADARAPRGRRRDGSTTRAAPTSRASSSTRSSTCSSRRRSPRSAPPGHRASSSRAASAPIASCASGSSPRVARARRAGLLSRSRVLHRQRRDDRARRRAAPRARRATPPTTRSRCGRAGISRRCRAV